MLVRLRSRDGLERVTVDAGATVGDLKQKISEQLSLPPVAQMLSTNQELLLSKAPQEFSDMRDSGAPLSSLGVAHGALVYLAYAGERAVAGPAAPVVPAGSFGRHMTIEGMIARQTRIERQETPRCPSLSFDTEAANAFQLYVREALAFSVQRGGFMYGRVGDGGEVLVDFIYEPPQEGTRDSLRLLRDAEEEKRVASIAEGLGMEWVGFIFSQSLGGGGEGAAPRDYTLSGAELRQAAALHAESGSPSFALAIVKLTPGGGGEEDGGGGGELEVHFEAFQLSDQCVRLYKDGWFVGDGGGGDESPGGAAAPPPSPLNVSRMKAPVVLMRKDVTEVDNDFFLVPVSILDHQGSLSTAFPVENRVTTANADSLRQHLQRLQGKPYVRRISDFHLLLFLSRFLDAATDVPQLAAAVRTQGPVPDGYQLIIDSL